MVAPWLLLVFLKVFLMQLITTLIIIIDLVTYDHPLAVVGDILVVGGGAVPAARAGADGATSARIWKRVGGAKLSEGGNIRRIRRIR